MLLYDLQHGWRHLFIDLDIVWPTTPVQCSCTLVASNNRVGNARLHTQSSRNLLIIFIPFIRGYDAFFITGADTRSWYD